jgi:antitoxin component YwqK of YwqJK toxin-antitoxin module
MNKFLIIPFLLFSLLSFSQEVKKENLTKKVTLYYDFDKTQPQATGFYYKDELGETTEKHGKWKYFDRFGSVEEEREYYRDMLYGKVMTYYSNRKPKVEGYFKFNKQDSISREWYENGKLKVEGEYKREKAAGKWTYYYFDGKLKSEQSIYDNAVIVNSFFAEDSAHTQTIIDGSGEMFTYYSTGSLKEYYQYKNGLKNGTFEEYSIYGYIVLSGSFIDGYKDGQWKYYFYTGDIEKIAEYKKGKLNGPYTSYYDSGELNIAGEYKDDKKTGKWAWNTNQGKTDMEGEFIDDLQHGNWTYYYPTGELSYRAVYKMGKKDGLWKYQYKDGSKFKEGPFLDDEKHGEWLTWYENGQLLMKGAYAAGKEEGVWLNYWDNGQLKNKSTFSNGALNGVWESFSISGKMNLKGTYVNSLKTDEWISFYENGMPKDLITYKVFKEKSKMNYSIMKDRVREESEMHGKFIKFSQKDFKRTEEGQYSRGKKDGEWIAYHTGGKMAAVVSNYKDGMLSGVMKQFDKRGIIISEIEYKDGLKDGKFIVYDRNGKIVNEKEFKNGIEVIAGGFNPGK